MTRFRKILKKSMLAFLLPGMLLYGASCRRDAPKVEEPEPTDYYAIVRSADKLILAEMTINKIATIDDLKLSDAKGGKQTWEALLNKVKIGNRKATYSYNTYLRAYMDMAEFTPSDIEVDTATKVMKIRLPEIRTEFAGRDVEVSEAHYRVTGLRSDIRPEERARVKEAVNESLRREVEERSGFREKVKATARGKAISYFTALARDCGFTAEIEIKQ